MVRTAPSTVGSHSPLRQSAGTGDTPGATCPLCPPAHRTSCPRNRSAGRCCGRARSDAASLSGQRATKCCGKKLVTSCDQCLRVPCSSPRWATAS
eukprot:5116858-Pyramimonas_sp.AAC.2